MKHSLLNKMIPAAAASVILAAGFATSSNATQPAPQILVKVGDHLGTTREEIISRLTGEGYSNFEFENEDGKIEVEATIQSVEVEFEIEAVTGRVVSVELED